jgi:transposase
VEPWVLPRGSPEIQPRESREYGTVLYRRRNEVERLFRLMQGFRRIFCRFEKLDMMYIGFIQLALVYLSIK